MANEYFVNSADLTAVADAIRAKGETTESLVFPSGFVTAIENIVCNAEPDILYLYNEGDMCVATSGGWSTKDIPLSSAYPTYKAHPTVVQNENSVKVSIGTNLHGYWYTTNMVNLTRYKTLAMVITAGTMTGGNAQAQIGIRSSLDGYSTDYNVSTTKLSNTGTITVDVSNLNAEYYIGVSLYSNVNLTIKQVYLLSDIEG